MFQPLYPSPHTGSPLRGKDLPNWMGVKGNESRLKRCRHCGWICDPDRDMRIKDGSFAGKGITYGAETTGSSYIVGGKTVEDTYNELTVTGGCPCCGSYRWGAE